MFKIDLEIWDRLFYIILVLSREWTGIKFNFYYSISKLLKFLNFNNFDVWQIKSEFSTRDETDIRIKKI